MIRHSSSFIISLILHALILLAIFFVYKAIPKKETLSEKKLEICLGTVSIKKPEKLIEKPKNQVKPFIKKEAPTPPKVKPPVKKKLPPIEKKTPKKVLKKKIIPIKKEIKVKPKEIIKEVVPIDTVLEETVAKKVPKEIPETKPLHIPKVEKETLETPEENALEKKVQLEQEYINKHIKKIAQLLSENLYYPRSARKRNIQGKIMVKFKLSTQAEVFDIEVTSSKSEVLSRAAIKTINNLSKKFPYPSEELHLHVPITYKLSK